MKRIIIYAVGCLEGSSVLAPKIWIIEEIINLQLYPRKIGLI